MLHREIRVCERLCLDALRGVDDEQRALARRERARDLVVEVDVARRVDQIERVDLPVGGGVIERDGAGLDRDAALALQVHVVKDLVLHLARRNGVALFKKPIRQRRLAVVDVRDDGKISDVLFVHSCCSCLLSARRRRAPSGASRRFAAGEILISCRAGNSSFLRCCGVPASRSA